MDNFLERYKKDIEMYEKEHLIYDKHIAKQNKNGISLFSNVLGNRCFQLLLSGYSSGQSMETLKSHGQEMFGHYLSSFKGSCYFDIQKAYEIAIIFDIPKEEVMKFYELQERLNYKDKYLDFLIKYFDNEHELTTDKLKANKALSPLVEVIQLAETDKEKAVLRLKTYLDKQWLNMQKEGLITNKQHLDPEKFRGYWCIESAALVKMLELDDEILKDSPYYPIKLVNYSRNKG